MGVESLKEQLGSGSAREAVIEDSLRVLDLEVAGKSGLTGVAVKGAFKLVKGVKPGFLRQVVDNLLDDFLEKVDPLYQEAYDKGGSPAQALVAHSGEVADGLLAVTDGRAERADNALVKKTYSKLRPTAKKHVEEAMPRLGEMLERHAKKP